MRFFGSRINPSACAAAQCHRSESTQSNKCGGTRFRNYCKGNAVNIRVGSELTIERVISRSRQSVKCTQLRKTETNHAILRSPQGVGSVDQERGIHGVGRFRTIVPNMASLLQDACYQ
jgi:hypothetical protein